MTATCTHMRLFLPVPENHLSNRMQPRALTAVVAPRYPQKSLPPQPTVLSRLNHTPTIAQLLQHRQYIHTIGLPVAAGWQSFF